MPDLAAMEILPADLAEHRAVKAWRQVCPELFEPERIEVLKLKKKSAVYRLTGEGAERSTVIAKRCPAATASLERMIYEEFLPRLPVPVLRCFGFLPDAGGEFCWLFIEDAGTHRYSTANDEHRALAARWLGTVHGAPLSAELRAALPDRGPRHYLQLLRASTARLRECFDNPELPAAHVESLRSIVAQCEVIQAHWSEVEKFWEGLPSRLVHGDFVIKNLRLCSGANGLALLVYDFEMAGWGVPATDLAQFLGKCVSPDLEVYHAALASGGAQLDERDLQRLADYGNVLRLVDKIFWETVTMQGDTYEFLLKPLVVLRMYEPQLAAALRAVNWSHHD